MSPERWQQVEKIFQTALDLAPEERERYVVRASAEDADLRHHVEALLKQYEEAEAAGDFLSEPLYEQSGMHALAALVNGDGDPMVGRRVGAYRIVREIGRGGMGAVYLAERADNAFQRRVAIKVIKRGMDTDFVLRRFRHERRILAALDHPNIARLLDGGATENGQPYFVMEYIEGQPFYQYCDTQRLGVRERLRLFCQVCEAVEYAHQNQIIHRDLKPSNVLVSTSGVPKLFDFGIAKLLNTELAEDDTTPQTATSMRLMTVEYASPEQVQGLPVTFLSDLYSLGVLMYELLTGHRPYRFRSRMLHEIARVISEEEPLPPSIVVSRSDDLPPLAHVDKEAMTVGDLCEMRSETPDSLRRELSGGLDQITLKAMRKEPSERYRSAAELRDDIVRFLEGRPINAPVYFPRATSAPKAATHSQPPAAKAIAVLPLKILNLSATTDTGDKFMSVGLADAMITRLSGVRTLAVRPTSAILRYGDETTDPVQAGRELGVDFVLDGRIKIVSNRIRVSLQLLDIQSATSIWANQFDERYVDALELEDSISIKVAEALLLELTVDPHEHLRKRGTDNPEAFEAHLRGRYFWNRFTPESLPKAIESFQKAIALDPNYALPHVGVSDFYIWACIYGILPPSECYPKARAAALRALELDDSLGEAYAALALIDESEWDWAEAERLHERALELNPNYGLAHEWYSSLLVGTGRFEEGMREIRLAEELDPLSARAITLTAWTNYQVRLYPECIAKARQIIDLDKNNPQGYLQLGNCLAEMGRGEEAVAAARQSLELMPDSALPKYTLCFALAAAGRIEEAREVLNEMKQAAATHYVKPYFLAMAHVALDERDAAFELFEQAFAERDPWITWFGTEPKLDRLREDPRFMKLFRQTNNPLAFRQQVTVEQKVTSREKSIAVLPLKVLGTTLTGDTDDNYLSVGLADAMITRLSNVRRLIVRPTSSVLRHGGSDTDPLAAGRALGVDFVLDGRIRHAGERIRISLQLLEVQTGRSAWAHQFDEQLTDMLSLEDVIAGQVVGILIPHLTGEERRRLSKRGTDDPEAFEAYLRGRYYWNTFTEEGLAKSLLCFQRAIETDPNYAIAYTGVADYYNWLGIYGVLPFSESSAAAKQYAARAVEMDDTLAEAYAALSLATLVHDFDWTTAESQLKRAIELNPNYPTARLWYSFQLTMEGRFPEALFEGERALQLDPLSSISRYNLGWHNYHARRYRESADECRRLVRDEPTNGMGHFCLGLALGQTGDTDEAIGAAQKATEFFGRAPYVLAGLGAAYAVAGRNAEAEEVIREMNEMTAHRYVAPYHIARVHCLLGHREQALNLLEQTFELNDAWVLWIGVEPHFDSLRDDPRYSELLRRINYPRL